MSTLKKFVVIVLAVLFFSASANLVHAMESFSCTSINKSGGVVNKGRENFEMGEQVTVVIQGTPLFCGKTEIRIIDFEGNKICSYNGNLSGGAGRQHSELHITARNLGYPSRYVAETYFRGKLVGLVRFRTYVGQ